MLTCFTADVTLAEEQEADVLSSLPSWALYIGLRQQGSLGQNCVSV